MPKIVMASSEGEHALYNNTLDSFGANDYAGRRGSVLTTWPQTIFFEWELADASADMWFHVRLAKSGGSPSSATPQTFLYVTDINGKLLAGARTTGSRDQNLPWFTQRGTSGSTASGAGRTDPRLVFHTLDIRIRISGTTLTLDFYFNQQLWESFVETGAATGGNPRRLYLRPCDDDSFDGNMNWQDVIITDGIPTVGMELVPVIPSAVGFHGDFANNYTALDESGYNTNDAIFTNAAGSRESWIHNEPVFDLSDKPIYAYVKSIVAQTDIAAAVSDFQPFVRIAGTDYAGVSVGATNLAPGCYINYWTQNPNTLASWTASDFSGIESGVLTV